MNKEIEMGDWLDRHIVHVVWLIIYVSFIVFIGGLLHILWVR